MQDPIVAEGVFARKGLYAHAIVSEPGRLLFSSGFLSRDPVTGAVGPKGDIREQTTRVLASIRHVLAAAGATFSDMTKMTVYVSDRKHYAEMNAVRREVLAGCNYASTTVIAKLVDTDALVEIDVVARLPDPGAHFGT